MPVRRTALVAMAFVLTFAAVGCSQVVVGSATASGSAVADIARAKALAPATLAATTAAAILALQQFWRAAFPATFGRPWRDIAQTLPVHTRDPRGVAPPCLDRITDLEGQALYCPGSDALLWDADELLPDVQRQFGTAGPVVVLAHEMGHAVQNRLGVDAAQAKNPSRYPTILLEAMADCDAGVAIAHLMQHPVDGLALGPVERDAALAALVDVRDPLGVLPGDEGAHGNAFDRVSAFQDGFSGDPARCAAMTLDNQRFTQRRFGSAAERDRQGDLPLPEVLEAVEKDATVWFGGVGAARTGSWTAPPLRTAPTGACPKEQLNWQGPVAYCAADGSVSVNADALRAVHFEVGDYADAVLVASRYGLAVLAAAGRGTAGGSAGEDATCLAGAYTARLIDPVRGFALSPGDLDEAVQVLLEYDWAARDDRGDPVAGERGYDRVARFRGGLLEGWESCFPPA